MPTFLTQIFEWLREHPQVTWSVSLVSVFAFVGTLLLVPRLVIRIPADYFVASAGPDRGARSRVSVVRRVLKNLLGVLLFALGVLLLFLPGQGLLTMLVGVLLIDFPGKRALERKMIQRPACHRPLNWIRRRAGFEPLLLPGAKGRASEHVPREESPDDLKGKDQVAR